MSSLGFTWKSRFIASAGGNDNSNSNDNRRDRSLSSSSSSNKKLGFLRKNKKGRGRTNETPFSLFRRSIGGSSTSKRRMKGLKGDDILDDSFLCGGDQDTESTLSLRDEASLSSSQFSSAAFRSSMLRCPPPNMAPVDEEEDESESTAMSTTIPSLVVSPSPETATSPISPSPAIPTTTTSGYVITRNLNRDLGYLIFQFSNTTRDHGDSQQQQQLLQESQVVLEEALEWSCQQQQQHEQKQKKPVLCLKTAVADPTTSILAEGGVPRTIRISDSWLRRRIGKEVLSHPLIVEAAETLFVTVHLLQASNNYSPNGTNSTTTFDLLDGESGSRLVPTLTAETMNRASVVRAMIQALELQQQPVPRYLQLLQEEEIVIEGGSASSSTCVFGITEEYEEEYGDDTCKDEKEEQGMGGGREVEFAGLDGVLATKSGYVNRRPVVEVTYDSKRLPFSCLVRHALQGRRNSNLVTVYYRSNDERIAAQIEMTRVQETTAQLQKLDCTTIQPCHNPKRALRRTPLRFVPLTDLQATRANRFVQLGRFDEAVHLLSPRQGLILMKAMQKNSAQSAFHDVIDVPILPAWISVCEKQRPKQGVEMVNKNSQKDTEQDELLPISMYEYDICTFRNRPPGFPWFNF